MQIEITKLNPDAKLPTYGSQHAAACDLYAAEEVFVQPNTVAIVHTGIAIELPIDCVGKIFPRSGHSRHHPNYVANNVGIIDADYRGEVLVMINGGRHGINVKKGARIAQLTVEQVEHVTWKEVDKLRTETARGDGALGSTGDD